jgi:hypothetical protein
VIITLLDGWSRKMTFDHWGSLRQVGFGPNCRHSQFVQRGFEMGRPRADIVEEIAGLANNSAGRRWDSLIVIATSTRALRHCSKSE